MLPAASRLKSHLPKILLRRGRIFCLCPARTLQASPHHGKEAGKRVLCSQVSWQATGAQILLRHGRICCLCPAHALQAILHHRKEAGKRVLCSQVSWQATSPKILLRLGRIFCLCPARTLQATLTTRKKPGNVFCVARSPDRLPAPKSYCATVGFVACALLTPYKPSLTTEKKPGSAFCAAKPLKKPLAAKSYYGAVGISLAGPACHILCPYLQAPLLKQRPRRFLDEALGFGLLSRLVRMFRGSNPPPRGFLHFCFCLGSCRAFKGQSFQGIQQSTLKALFPYS